MLSDTVDCISSPRYSGKLSADGHMKLHSVAAEKRDNIPQDRLKSWYLRSRLMGIDKIGLAYWLSSSQTIITSHSVLPLTTILSLAHNSDPEHWAHRRYTHGFRTLSTLRAFCQAETNAFEFKGKKGVYDRVWHVQLMGKEQGREIRVREVLKKEWAQNEGAKRKERIGLVCKELSVRMRRSEGEC